MSPSTVARAVKPCARCQHRKIKCDGLVPICGACDRSKLQDCNVSDFVMYSYQHVDGLNQRIAWLEKLVSVAYEDSTAIQDIPSGSILSPRGTNIIRSEPFVEEVGVLSLKGFGIGSMSGVTLTRLVSSAIRMYDQEFKATIEPEEFARVRGAHAAYPPMELAREYVKAYLSRVHRWYPFLDLTNVAGSLVSLHSREHLSSSTQRFMMLMIFALGSTEQNASDPFRPEDYFTTAFSFLPGAIALETLDTVRCLLLLCMYGLRSWRRNGEYSVNVWLVVGHALRLSVSLGISRNRYTTDDAGEAGRKVWWSVYAVERYVATGLSRVLSIRNTAIDAIFPRATFETIPDSLSDFIHMQRGTTIDLTAAKALYRQRTLLGDIQETIYVALRPDGPPVLTVEETKIKTMDIQSRLAAWAQDTMTFTSDTIERDVLHLAFHQATLLLYRPTPHFPIPTHEALDLSMGAARGIIRICGAAVQASRLDDVLPGWAGFHEVFMSGVTLLYCTMTGSTCSNAIDNPTSDPEVQLSLQTLEHLASIEPCSRRYLELYRNVVSQISSILAPSVSHPLGPSDMDQVAQDSGLVSLDELELDPESIELVNRLLLAIQGSH